MRFTYITILFILSPLIGLCQFTGGNNDGYSNVLLPRTNITDDNAFKGGTDDGFTNTLLPKTNITDAAAFKGGNDDGFHNLLLARINITDDNAFRGGNDDGFNHVLLVKTNITDAAAFRGGNDDGFTYILLNKTNITDPIAFTGGIGRGETQIRLSPVTCDGSTFIWNGSVSNAWENPDNWDCGILPNISSTVIIPTAVPNYPRVNFNFEIKKLTLNSNATIIIMAGVFFKLNGL